MYSIDSGSQQFPVGHDYASINASKYDRIYESSYASIYGRICKYMLAYASMCYHMLAYATIC